MARWISLMCVVGMMVAVCYGADVYVPPKGAIQSLCVRDKDVFASTCEGVYRAVKSKKQWKKLPIPESMPTGGRFADQPRASHAILYIGTKYVPCGLTNTERNIYGLYRSADSGQTWSIVSTAYDFQSVYVHPNGTIYAIVEQSDSKTLRWLILMSKDNGKSWRDITGSIAVGYVLAGIFQDPDHPDLICLRASCIRGTVFQAAGQDYDWKGEFVWNWEARHQTDESFLERSANSNAYNFQPTLSNYFAKGAPETTPSYEFDIVPEKPVYHFSLSGPKTISISVRFLPDKKVTLPDFPDSADMWSVRVIGPDGKRISTTAVADSAVSGVSNDKRDAKASELRNSQRFSAFTVDPTHPYHRSIDLGKLYSFPQTGDYRVQLMYDSTLVADKEKGQWSRYFTGQVFTVSVK